MVELSGKNRALNEFSVERVGEEADQHLVMLHGYGAGLGFFYKNFEPLSRLRGWQLHALDMLGMGRSTRPPFRIKAKGREEAIREAEDWFVDALEEWRIKRKIDRFTLLGHSLGGYMAVSYALKYPGHLNKLILASPVGIPEDPYAVTADVPEQTDSSLGNELTQDQQEIAAAAAAPGTAPKTADGGFITGRNAEPPVEQNRPPRRTLPKWFAYLWDANISPSASYDGPARWVHDSSRDGRHAASLTCQPKKPRHSITIHTRFSVCAAVANTHSRTSSRREPLPAVLSSVASTGSAGK